jgi:hypothetical protein
MFLQPFVAYQASRTWTITTRSEMTANWNVDGGRSPFHGQVGTHGWLGAYS